MRITELLSPIPGENPSGANLRYSQVYERLREARREEDATTQGEWAREIKKADYAAVVKLATDALARQTKDLQIAAWLVDATTRLDGFGALAEGLECVRNLLEQYWETIYPQLENGDPEMRAAPLDWLATYLNAAVVRVPLTYSGIDWLRFRESRGIPYEQECAEHEIRMAARNEAIAEGKLPPEEFDRAVAATPKNFYENCSLGIASALGSLQLLSDLCDSRFGDAAPNFAKLRGALEEIQLGLESLAPAQAQVRQPAQAEEPVRSQTQGDEPDLVGFESSTPAPPAPVLTTNAEPASSPASSEGALSQLIAITRFLRATAPGNPVPYLLLRAYRWGELRSSVETLDAALLEPPSSVTRLQLKQLEQHGEWLELLEATENAMAAPCGRAWLDLQRYAVRCCEELGGDYAPVANAITAELRSLLAKFPELPQLALIDDTPCASIGTQQWLRDLTARMPLSTAAFTPSCEVSTTPDESSSPEPVREAERAILDGHPQEVLQLLVRDISRQADGRHRFLHRIQVARFCVEHGFEAIAEPILQDLVDEFQRRRLDAWEPAQMLAEPVALLLLCVERLERDPGLRRAIFERLCRLDPVRALAFSQIPVGQRAA